MPKHSTKEILTAEHTPAPWVAIGNETVACVYAGPRRNKFICEVKELADARLISASHDLLGALQDILEVIEDKKLAVPARKLKDAKKAINKAKGAPT